MPATMALSRRSMLMGEQTSPGSVCGSAHHYHHYYALRRAPLPSPICGLFCGLLIMPFGGSLPNGHFAARPSAWLSRIAPSVRLKRETGLRHGRRRERPQVGLPTMTLRRALIVGGSMAGLLSALFLRRRGWDVALFERSPVPLTGRGAGIMTHP